MAVEHQPGDTVDQDALRYGRVAADVLRHVMSRGGKKAAFPAALIDSAFAQRARKGPAGSWHSIARLLVRTTAAGSRAILKRPWGPGRFGLVREPLHHSSAPSL